MSYDTEKLRSLLERLETHTSLGWGAGSYQVWCEQRDLLVARVNAYAALVLHDVALSSPTDLEART